MCGNGTTCSQYFKSNSPSNPGLIYYYTMSIAVQPGYSVYTISDPTLYKKGAFFMVQLLDGAMLALNTDGNSVSDYILSNPVKPLNSSFNWRFCFKALITRPYYFSSYLISYSPYRQGVYNFSINAFTAGNFSQIYFKPYRFISNHRPHSLGY